MFKNGQNTWCVLDLRNFFLKRALFGVNNGNFVQFFAKKWIKNLKKLIYRRHATMGSLKKQKIKKKWKKKIFFQIKIFGRKKLGILTKKKIFMWRSSWLIKSQPYLLSLPKRKNDWKCDFKLNFTFKLCWRKSHTWRKKSQTRACD